MKHVVFLSIMSLLIIGGIAWAIQGNVLPAPNGITIPEGYKDAAEVEAIVRKAYRKFYFRPGYVWKHIKKIRDVDTVKQYLEALRFIAGIAFTK